MNKQIEKLLAEVEALYEKYHSEMEDWGQLCKRIEELHKQVKKIRKMQAKAVQS